jgi:3-hydroxymyristoyl/3-hydroxydecanoyl-(acyl carrier protein) dehydratase
MDKNWYRISHIKDAPSGMVLAEACADAGSLWFSGHFPDEPILPGIAILSMVMDVIRHHEAEKGRKVRIAGVRRVRFKLQVRPDELLKISMSSHHREEDLVYHFAVLSKGKKVCTGIAAAELRPEERCLHNAFS